MLREKRPRSALPILNPRRASLPLLESRPIDQKIRPRHAVWELTLRCDQACRHCGSRAAVARPHELATDECLDLVRQLAELGVMEVTVIGGEAYLRPDLVEIIRAIRTRGMHCTMTTGGRGLGRELAEALAAAGLVSASVSIAGCGDNLIARTPPVDAKPDAVIDDAGGVPIYAAAPTPDASNGPKQG